MHENIILTTEITEYTEHRIKQNGITTKHTKLHENSYAAQDVILNEMKNLFLESFSHKYKSQELENYKNSSVRNMN